MSTDIAASNSLADLRERAKAEHAAVAGAMKANDASQNYEGGKKNHKKSKATTEVTSQNYESLSRSRPQHSRQH